MMHKAWSSIEEVPYCFARSSIKFDGHTGGKIDDFESYLRLLGRSQLSNPSDLPCFLWNTQNGHPTVHTARIGNEWVLSQHCGYWCPGKAISIHGTEYIFIISNQKHRRYYILLLTALGNKVMFCKKKLSSCLKVNTRLCLWRCTTSNFIKRMLCKLHCQIKKITSAEMLQTIGLLSQYWLW